MKNPSQIRKLYLNLSSEKEREDFSSVKIFEILDKFDELYEQFKCALEKRDGEYAEALQLLIEETDKKVRTYLTSLSTSYTEKLGLLNTALSKVEEKTGSTEVNLRDQINSAKREIKDFSDKIYKIQASNRDETVESIEKAINQGKKNLKDFESRTSNIYEELESIRKEVVEKFSSSVGRGGAMHRLLQLNGVQIATRYADINFVVSGWTATNDDVNKITKITIAATGGSVQTPTSGSVNGTNQVFVFTTAPSIVFADNVPYQKVSSDGSVNWTGTTTITLSQPPQHDLFAI